MELFPTDPRTAENVNLDSATAALLLSRAECVGVDVVKQTDFRALSVIQGWVAATSFVYVATFLVLFAHPGTSEGVSNSASSYVNVLVIPFLLFSQLVQGARSRLPIIASFPQRLTPKLLLILPGVAIFAAAATAYIIGVRFPWWGSLLIACAIAAPLGILAIVSASKARGHAFPRPNTVHSRQLLSRTAARMTAGLGCYLGVLAALTPYGWFPVAAGILTFVLVMLVAGWTARWGLPSVGSEWGFSDWVGFGIAFTLLFAVAIVAARTPWDTPFIGILGGAVIAAPLFISAIKPPRHQ